MKSLEVRIAGDRSICGLGPITLLPILLGQSPAYLTSDDFVKANEIIRTK